MSEPSNEALAIMLGNLDNRVADFREINENSHQTMIEQLKKTNGRVTFLEKGFWMLTGGLVIVSAIAVPLFLGLLKSKYNI